MTKGRRRKERNLAQTSEFMKFCKLRYSKKLKKGWIIPHEKVPLFWDIHFLSNGVDNPASNLT
jgi:hypothetical protein